MTVACALLEGIAFVAGILVLIGLTPACLFKSQLVKSWLIWIGSFALLCGASRFRSASWDRHDMIGIIGIATGMMFIFHLLPKSLGKVDA